MKYYFKNAIKITDECNRFWAYDSRLMTYDLTKHITKITRDKSETFLRHSNPLKH